MGARGEGGAAGGNADRARLGAGVPSAAAGRQRPGKRDNASRPGFLPTGSSSPPPGENSADKCRHATVCVGIASGGVRSLPAESWAEHWALLGRTGAGGQEGDM